MARCLAVGRDHLLEVAGHGRIVGVDGVRHAGVAMPVVPDADAHGLEELVGAHERRVDLDRHRLLGAGGRVLPHVDRGAGRRLVRDHGMAGVGLVLDQHLPIAVVHVAQHAARHLEPALRRAVDHVVEARQRLAEELLEAQADIVQLGEDEAAVVVHVAHRRHAARGVAVGKARAVVALLQRERRPGCRRGGRSRHGRGSGRSGRHCRRSRR